MVVGWGLRGGFLGHEGEVEDWGWCGRVGEAEGGACGKEDKGYAEGDGEDDFDGVGHWEAAICSNRVNGRMK